MKVNFAGQQERWDQLLNKPSWVNGETKPSYTASEVGAIAISEKGQPNGVASLDGTGKVLEEQLPSISSADKRIYIAGKNIKAGEILDVQPDGTVNKTNYFSDAVTNLNSTTLLDINMYNIADYSLLGLEDGKFIFVYTYGTVHWIKLLYWNGFSIATLSSADISNLSTKIAGVFKIFNSKIAIVAINKLTGHHSIFICSYENDTLSLINTIDTEFGSVDTCAVQISENSICIVGPLTQESNTCPTACVISELDKETPLIGNTFFLNTAWGSFNELSAIKYQSYIIVVYRGYNHSSLPRSFVGAIIDINNQIFLDEITLQTQTNDYLDYNYLVNYNKSIYFVTQGSSSSGSPKKLFLQKLIINGTQLSLSDYCLNQSIISTAYLTRMAFAQTGDFLTAFDGLNIFIFQQENASSEKINVIDQLKAKGSYTGESPQSIQNQCFIIKVKPDLYYLSRSYKATNASDAQRFINICNYFVYKDTIGKTVSINADQCIALHDANLGDNIEVIFNGMANFPGIKEGDSIISTGIYGAGIKEDTLMTWGKYQPRYTITGQYIGTGKYGKNNPTEIVFPGPVQRVIIYCNALSHYCWLLINGSTQSFCIDGELGYSQVIFDNNIVKIMNTGYAKNQLNESNVIYKYIAFI